MDLIAVTGRFQPLHNDHLALMHIALDRAEHLIVGITNPDERSRVEHPDSAHRHTDDANPFSYFQRAAWVRAALEASGVNAHRFTVTPFPLERPDLWLSYIPVEAIQLVRAFSPWERSKAVLLEAVYPVSLLDGDPASRITATEIRSAINNGDSGWQARVPDAVVQSLP